MVPVSEVDSAEGSNAAFDGILEDVVSGANRMGPGVLPVGVAVVQGKVMVSTGNGGDKQRQ